MTKIDFKYHIHWVHMLAWRTLDNCELSQDERKAIGAFIGNVKKGGYISNKNTLLLKVAGIIDEHLPVKSTAMPVPKTEYDADEKKEIRKGIRDLFKSAKDDTAVKGFCFRFLKSKTGKPRTKPHSENRYWHARMTIDSQA